jgi:ATP-binding cassette subfamily F protein 2
LNLRPYTKDYVFKSDLVAMMRSVAMNRKTDQDDLREALEKLKSGEAGTPVTLDSFLAWKTGKAEARKVRDDKVREERQKRGSYTGRELCESGEVTNATDEGNERDGEEMMELIKLRKQADEEEIARIAAEALAMHEKAKSSGVEYGYSEYDYGGTEVGGISMVRRCSLTISNPR